MCLCWYVSNFIQLFALIFYFIFISNPSSVLFSSIIISHLFIFLVQNILSALLSFITVFSFPSLIKSYLSFIHISPHTYRHRQFQLYPPLFLFPLSLFLLLLHFLFFYITSTSYFLHLFHFHSMLFRFLHLFRNVTFYFIFFFFFLFFFFSLLFLFLFLTPYLSQLIFSLHFLGSLSGIVAKLVSYVDGNKNNKDSGLVSAGTYGAYFGTYVLYVLYVLGQCQVFFLSSLLLFVYFSSLLLFVYLIIYLFT